MNKMDLLKEVEEMLYHNLLCYSKNYLRNEPKKEYVKEWEKTNEQIGLVKEIMKDVQRNIQQTISYQVRNGESDIIGSFCILNQAIAFAEKKKKEYVRNCDNSKVWVEIEGEEKEIYIAKGYTNEETEEFE
ncbi:MAG: hypothetical protein HFJ54_09105 [Clostridia bacterium]|nr:hypothetical protein [Clostridia bacterium]